MSERTTIDRVGRLVIPKPLRDRYGFEPGTEVAMVPTPDGITLVPARRERRLIRVGRVVAIDTGADTATGDVFDVAELRKERIDRSGGLAR